MKRFRGIVFILMLCVLLSGCTRRTGIEKDWVYMSYEEALELYRSVDFTVDNISEYFSTSEVTAEYYNEWDELESITYTTLWGLRASNYVKFDTPLDEFLMDYSFTIRSQTLKLDPDTLEIMEVLYESTHESNDTISAFPMHGIAMSYYTINYEKDGSIKLNEKGELIVQKHIKENFRIERVRGHAEWIQDIPEKFMMDTDHYSYGEGMIEGEYIRFFVVEANGYHYTYENYDHDDFNDFQTKAFKTNGSGYRCVGKCVSFVRGFEDEAK